VYRRCSPNQVNSSSHASVHRSSIFTEYLRVTTALCSQQPFEVEMDHFELIDNMRYIRHRGVFPLHRCTCSQRLSSRSSSVCRQPDVPGGLWRRLLCATVQQAIIAATMDLLARERIFVSQQGGSRLEPGARIQHVACV
jgi:hypothetical protein